MTQTEALKLALEALLHAYHEDEAHPKTLDAITAIKEALAQPEQEPVAWAGVDFDIKTTPPQRKPLTDWEISNVYFDATGQGLRLQDKALVYKFARAIEAKLKEKNTS